MDGFPLNLMLGTSMKICQEAPNFVTIEQKHLILHTKTAICFTFVGDINLA